MTGMGTVMMMGTWVGLSLLGFGVLFVFFERWMYSSCTPLIDPEEFPSMCRKWKGSGFWGYGYSHKELGWFAHPLSEAHHKLGHLEKNLVLERGHMESFDRFLRMTANVAPLLGLLGSVLAILGTSIGGGDPASMIGQGLKTTAFGIIIAVPTYVMVSVLGRRTEALLDQFDAIDELLGDQLEENRLETVRREEEDQLAKLMDKERVAHNKEIEALQSKVNTLMTKILRKKSEEVALEVLRDESPIEEGKAVPETVAPNSKNRNTEGNGVPDSDSRRRSKENSINGTD